MEIKKCSKCNIEKEIKYFNKNKTTKDGLEYYCKICRKKPKNIILYCKIIDKNYLLLYKKYRIKIYNTKNKDLIKNKREKLKDYHREYNKTWNQKNKEKIKRYQIERYNKEPFFKLTKNIRNSIYKSFRKVLNGKYIKSRKTEIILGCSFEEFKQYLESKFEPWMTWENHGKYNGELNFGWDIDHIIPISSAKTEEDIIKLNHYTNLQPLCSKVNRDVKRNFLF